MYSMSAFDCTPPDSSHIDLPHSAAYNAGMDLTGKVVVVTGASMGIGEAIAKIFADDGAGVVMLSRDPGRIEAARARVGHLERTVGISCDVRHREDIDRARGFSFG